jgi:MFS superfamily sulfate permease-like transporter
MGLYAGIFQVLACAVPGSSREFVIGPDTATCLLLAASVAPLAGGDAARHVALVSAVTLLGGALFLIARAARLGFLAEFLSRPILTGFMNGVALVVAARTDSRTAVNAAAGARTRFAAVIAALTMLGAAFLLSDLISQAPAAVFGGMVFVAVLGPFYLPGLRDLWRVSRREAAISAMATLGVLTLGVLPGVPLAVMLSPRWLLSMALRLPTRCSAAFQASQAFTTSRTSNAPRRFRVCCCIGSRPGSKP